ncbi:MAG: hypothetical protein U1F56_06815 [Rubrivivax sp.]
MIDSALASWAAWWDTVPPAFAFLLALPVLVAAAGLIGDSVRRRRRGRG